MLIYDGLHYDALAVWFFSIYSVSFPLHLSMHECDSSHFSFLCCKHLLLLIIFLPDTLFSLLQLSPFEGGPEEFDQTLFSVERDRTIGPVEGLALNLAKDQHR